MNQLYGSMLDEIESQRYVPRYKPVKGEQGKSLDERTADWLYRSGVDAGIEMVLRYLGYER